MTVSSRFVPICAVILSLAHAASPKAAEAWVAESDRHAMQVMQVLGQIDPERASDLGATAYDGAILDLRADALDRHRAALREVIAKLQLAHRKESQQPVAQDLTILIEYCRNELRRMELEDEHLLPYHDVSRTMYEGIRALLDPRNARERHPAALTRLRKYAGVEPGSSALAELAMARTRAQFDAQLLGPFRDNVEQDLVRSAVFLRGIEALFAATKLTDWRAPYQRLVEQMAVYNAWLKNEVLPRARADHRLPGALYAAALRDRGVSAAPEALIDEGLKAFMEIRNEMATLAPLVAKERGYRGTGYLDVLRSLKEAQLPGDRVLAHYEHTLKRLEALIGRERLVSLPQRAAAIRIGTEAETANQPAPHLNPPRLIGNAGEYPEFVLPYLARKADGSWPQTDDTFEANAWSLTAHEARPGHELQFSVMVERGISLARAVFAWNSANIEGWGLYAEAIAKPHMPLDGQLVSLQWRLLRAARMFLDPMLNLGLTTPAQAKRLLVEQIGVTEQRAQDEIERYMYRMPGQATAYYYGYARLQAIRARTEMQLGRQFDALRLHDFILAQGFLPPELLADAVAREFLPR